MIQVSSLRKQYGPQLLFENISFQLGKGEKIGLVGRNGTGKSTLFKIILGEESYDGGSVSIPKNYSMGSLEQHIKFTHENLKSEVASILKDEEKFDTYKVEKILFGLGFSKSDMEKDPMNFSGGFQLRINLAKVLLRHPNLLLLDEPTNYLDIVSLRWLANFLRSFLGEIIIITHDREFMDSITTHTMGLQDGVLRKLKGSSVKYFEKIEMEEQILEKTRVNQDKKRQDLEKFVERFRAKASKASQAQSKLKQLQKMDKIEAGGTSRNPFFRFQFQECPGKELLRVKDLTFSYTPEGDEIVKDFSMNVKRNDRIGIIGKNGKGKSTLLNLLAEELSPNNGEIKYHPKVLRGHFGQTNVKRLDDKQTIIEEIYSSNSLLGTAEIRGIAGSLMFSGEMAEKKIQVLSGGERARVLIGKIMAKPSNLLFLDEPTNHLDIESIEILKKEIEEFQGAVIMVTHNEGLLKGFANKLVVFQKGIAEVFDGDYSEFLNKVGWEGEDSVKEGSRDTSEKLSKKEVRRLKAELQTKKAKILGPLKEEIVSIEDNITKLEKYRELINSELIISSSKGDSHKIEESSKIISEIDTKIDELFELLEEKTSHQQMMEDEVVKELDDLENQY